MKGRNFTFLQIIQNHKKHAGTNAGIQSCENLLKTAESLSSSSSLQEMQKLEILKGSSFSPRFSIRLNYAFYRPSSNVIVSSLVLDCVLPVSNSCGKFLPTKNPGSLGSGSSQSLLNMTVTSDMLGLSSGLC